MKAGLQFTHSKDPPHQAKEGSIRSDYTCPKAQPCRGIQGIRVAHLLLGWLSNGRFGPGRASCLPCHRFSRLLLCVRLRSWRCLVWPADRDGPGASGYAAGRGPLKVSALRGLHRSVHRRRLLLLRCPQLRQPLALQLRLSVSFTPSLYGKRKAMPKPQNCPASIWMSSHQT